MSVVEYFIILRTCLLIPLFLINEACLVCHMVFIDTFGEHTFHCREFLGFKFRHNFVKDLMFDIF